MTTITQALGDDQLVDALRRGDEQAFERLVRAHSPAMLRLAVSIVGSRAVAEEVLQETWLAVVEGIDRFERRSLLTTWIFRILTNRAVTRARRERRSVPFSALVGDDAEPAVAADRFLGPDARYPGHWASIPERWHERPEARLASKEILEVIAGEIAGLPSAQRAVITLRDVEGWGADEVCEALQISDGNQRVLLHRARARVRQALEDRLGATA